MRKKYVFFGWNLLWKWTLVHSPVWKCIRLPLCASYPQGVDAIFVVLLCGFKLLACLSREQVVQGGDVDVCPSGSGVIA